MWGGSYDFKRDRFQEGGESFYEQESCIPQAELAKVRLHASCLTVNNFFDTTEFYPQPHSRTFRIQASLFALFCFDNSRPKLFLAFIHKRIMKISQKINKKPGRLQQKVCWSRWKWKICFSCDHSHPRLIFPSLDFNLTISITCNLSTGLALMQLPSVPFSGSPSLSIKKQ